MTIFKDDFCQEPMMAQTGLTYGQVFLSRLTESRTPANDVTSFLNSIRGTTSVLGRQARDHLDTDDPDYQRVIGWLKQMAMWSNKGEAAAKNLAISHDSPADLLEAARVMGMLQAWNQALGCALPNKKVNAD